MGVGRGVHWVQNPLSPHTNIIFDKKWKKEKGEIGGKCLHFLHCRYCEVILKHWSWHYLFWTVGGGLMLVEVEVFSGVGGGGSFFQRNLFFYAALIIS